MSFTYASITHSYLNLDGTPASGKVTFQLSGAMRNSGITFAPSMPMVCPLSAGSLIAVLPANNDPGTVPDGVTYLVTEEIASMGTGTVGQTFTILVPTDGGSIDLASLLPQDSA